MMKSQLIAGIIVIVIVGIGGYFFVSRQTNTPQGMHGADTNGKPAAQSHRSYNLEVTSNTSNITPKQAITFSYKIKNDKGEVLKNYEITHEKIMHFIAVRKDLSNFQHLHPEFNQSTGEFTVMVTFPGDGPYRLFPDFTPGEENPQKLPVTVYHDVEVGNSSKYYAQSVVPDTEQTKTYGDYKIAITFPKDAKKQQEITYSLNITKDGKLVTNLENYLGALGHSVILKEGSLDFIHTHALEATSGEHSMQQEITSTGPKISFTTSFPESGVYKIFTQFQQEGEIQTVDNIVRIQ